MAQPRKSNILSGTFQSCYAVVETGSNDTTWYAPDIGMVAGTYQKSKYELTSYSVIVSGTIPKQVPPKQLPGRNRIDRNVHFIIDPLGRCVERAVRDSYRIPLNTSPGVYIIYRQGNESSEARNTGTPVKAHPLLNLY